MFDTPKLASGLFIWIYDAKDIKKTDYEKFLEYASPMLVGANSITKAMPTLPGYDYERFLRKYDFGEKLPDNYSENGIDIVQGDGFNIGKILQESIKFEDSKKYAGLQIADILASSLRRCLRNEWKNSELMTEAIAHLFVDRGKPELPISIMFFNGALVPDENVRETLILFKRHCKDFLKDSEHVLSQYKQHQINM